MAKQLKKIFAAGTDEVVQDFTINSWHVSQSVDALTAAEAYDISISGSLNVTGSVNIKELDTDAALTNFVVIDTSTGTLKKRTGGSAGTNGSSGTSGSSGSSGTSGSSGSSGTSGVSVQGPAGNAGSSGTDGSSGTSGTAITGLDTQVLYFDGDDNPAGDSELTWDDTNKTLRISSGDDGTSGKNNLILTNEVVNPKPSLVNLGNIVGKSPDDATGVVHSKIQFESDGEWIYAGGAWAVAPTSMAFYVSEFNYPEIKFEISGSGQLQAHSYGITGRFVSTNPTYMLGTDTAGNVVQVSPNYAGNDYNIVTANRIDYNSNTSDNFASSTPYQFVIDTATWGSAIPDAGKILIDNATKSSISGLKINIGAFTQEMNIVTPTSQSRVIIGNTAGDYATYNIKKSTIEDGGVSGNYLTLVTEWVSNAGTPTFTAGSNLGALRFRPISNTTTSTIYPISNYYTSIVFGNLSSNNDVNNTIFGFWLDETFRGTLVSGDELIVSAKFSSTTGFSTTGNTMNFITFNNDGSPTTPPVLRRNFLTRIQTPASPAVFEVSNTQNNWGPTQIFKFQYWERGEDEYGLIELNSFNTRQQNPTLN